MAMGLGRFCRRHPFIVAAAVVVLAVAIRSLYHTTSNSQAQNTSPLLDMVHAHRMTLVQSGFSTGDWALVIRSLQESAAVDAQFFEKYPVMLYNMAQALLQDGNAFAATQYLAKFLKQHPDHVEALQTSAVAHDSLQDPGRTVHALTRAAAVMEQRGNLDNPGAREQLAKIYSDMGTAQRKLGRFPAADISFQTALERLPGFPPAVLGQAITLQQAPFDSIPDRESRLDASVEALPPILSKLSHHQNALAAEVRFKWSVERSKVEVLEETLDFFSAEVKADRSIMQPMVLLFMSVSPEEVARHHKRFWQHRYAKLQPLSQSAPKFEREGDRSGDHQVKIGFMTSNLVDRHPMGQHLLQILGCLEELGSNFEYVVITHDDIGQGLDTAKAYGLSTRVLDCGETAIACAKMIAREEVDILVDLNQYTEFTGAGILALKPAPVQVSYHGSSNPIGADGVMDYIIADPICFPASAAKHFPEAPAYLSSWVYTSDNAKRPVVKASRTFDAFTFVSVNNPKKLNPRVLKLWKRILDRAPGAKLHIKAAEEFLDELTKKFGFDRKQLVAISKEKLEREDYLKMMASFDLHLSPFPFSGVSTHADTVVAGLPTITMISAEATWVERAAAAVNLRLGFGDLVVYNEKEYEEQALNLYNERDKLKNIRRKLAESDSSWFDISNHVHQMEHLFTSIWDVHRKGEQPSALSVGRRDLDFLLGDHKAATLTRQALLHHGVLTEFDLAELHRTATN